MATLQVKGLDDGLYRALGARAAMDNRSISQEVVMMIQQFLGRPPQDPREATGAALELAGTWQDERTPEQIATELRKSRRSASRFRKEADVFD